MLRICPNHQFVSWKPPNGRTGMYTTKPKHNICVTSFLLSKIKKSWVCCGSIFLDSGPEPFLAPHSSPKMFLCMETSCTENTQTLFISANQFEHKSSLGMRGTRWRFYTEAPSWRNPLILPIQRVCARCVETNPHKQLRTASLPSVCPQLQLAKLCERFRISRGRTSTQGSANGNHQKRGLRRVTASSNYFLIVLEKVPSCRRKRKQKGKKGRQSHGRMKSVPFKAAGSLGSSKQRDKSLYNLIPYVSYYKVPNARAREGAGLAAGRPSLAHGTCADGASSHPDRNRCWSRHPDCNWSWSAPRSHSRVGVPAGAAAAAAGRDGTGRDRTGRGAEPSRAGRSTPPPSADRDRLSGLAGCSLGRLPLTGTGGGTGASPVCRSG